jgi:hypothetical protein
LKKGTIGWHDMSVKKYHHTLLNDEEEAGSLLLFVINSIV